MPGRLSSGEREFATLVAQLCALEKDIDAARHAAHHPPAPRGRDRHVPRDTPGALRGERVKLTDGAEIVVRPIEPEDLQALAVGFGSLGALSRFRRFRGDIDRLTSEQLVELTHVDHENHEALVALDAATGEGVAVARYVRSPDDPKHAEVACTVLDPWQHRGVGSALAKRLAERARAAGIDRCTALLVIGDERPRRLLAHVADPIAERRDGGIVDITARARRASP